MSVIQALGNGSATTQLTISDLLLQLELVTNVPMPDDQLGAFLEAVKTNPGLVEQLRGATTVEANVAIAKAAGFTITPEDIVKVHSRKHDLADEELENVAGGAKVRCGISITCIFTWDPC